MEVSPILENPDLLEEFIKQISLSNLRIDITEHSVLLTESNVTDKEFRNKLSEILFEKIGVASMFFYKTAPLCSFAFGRSTSLVLESGARETTVVAVIEGYPTPKTCIRDPTAGNYITNKLSEHLVYANIKPPFCFTRRTKLVGEYEEAKNELVIEPHEHPALHETFYEYSKREVVENIKKSKLKFLLDSTVEETVSCELPDGQLITIPNSEFSLGDLLFSSESFNISSMLQTSVSRAPEHRKELFANVIVAGGNTLFPYFTEKLAKEASQHAAGDSVNLLSLPERQNTAWIGGSLLTALSGFSPMWVTAQDYREFGRDIFERKCPS